MGIWNVLLQEKDRRLWVNKLTMCCMNLNFPVSSEFRNCKTSFWSVKRLSECEMEQNNQKPSMGWWSFTSFREVQSRNIIVISQYYSLEWTVFDALSEVPNIKRKIFSHYIFSDFTKRFVLRQNMNLKKRPLIRDVLDRFMYFSLWEPCKSIQDIRIWRLNIS